MTPPFEDSVYRTIREGTQRSAGVIAPMLLGHLSLGDRTPQVLDVGCGEGWWGFELQRLGCRVVSIDQETPGEPAPGVQILELDLEAPDYMLLPRNGYDLGVCLEVAEHLTGPAGERLVAELCASCRVIAFSAAIPGQGGHGHVNERWPTYWHELFKAHGYVLADPWRDTLWDDPDVEPWYAQNLLLAMRAAPAILPDWQAPRCLVHPTIWLHHRFPGGVA